MTALVHRSRGLALAALLVAAALAAPPASAQDDVTLYVAATDGGFDSGASPSTLYTVDPETGIATEVGPIGFDNVTGLAMARSENLWASAQDDYEDENGPVQRAILISVDPATGEGVFVGPVDDNAIRPAAGQPNPKSLEKCGRMDDLALQTTSGVLYGMGAACRSLNNATFDDTAVYVIDKQTGRGAGRQRAGPVPAFTGYKGVGNGIAWDPRSNVFYFASNDDLILLDTVFSCTVLADCPIVGNLGDPVYAMEFHPLTGVLYGSQRVGDEAYLVTIDVSDCTSLTPVNCGDVTTIGLLRDAEGTPLAVDALAFRGPINCPPAPYGPCSQSGYRGGKLTLKGKQGKLLWKWKGGGTQKSSLGDPTADTNYRICLTDFTDLTVPMLVAWFRVPAGENWKLTNAGYRYKSKDGAPDGIQKLKINANLVPKESRVRIKGKDLPLPPLPLELNTRTVVQLVNDDGTCWDSEFYFPSKKNDEKGFKGKE